MFSGSLATVASESSSAVMTISREAIHEFIATLEIPVAERERLLALTPGSYTGHAAALARRIG